MKTPVMVYFSGNGTPGIYNLTEQQFNMLLEKDDWETINKFELAISNLEHGYAPGWLITLSAIYGFKVDSI